MTIRALEGRAVLVVDDNADLRLLARMALGGAGAMVLECRSASSALEALTPAKYLFDLVLMDMELETPLGGLAAVRALREQGYSGRIAAYTAHVSGAFRAEALAAGCTAFIPKIGGQAALVDAVREAIK